MSLVFIDGFDYLPLGRQDGILNSQYWTGSVSDLTVTAPGRFDYGNCLNIGNVGSRVASRLMPKNMGVDGEMSYVGIAIKNPQDNKGNGEYQWISFSEGVSSGTIFSITMERYGVIKLRRGTRSGTIIATSSPLGTFAYNRWFYLEVGFSVGHAANVEIRLNGVTIIDAIDIDNLPLGLSPWWNLFQIGHFNGGYSIDDVYVCDGLGTLNSDFLGNARVRTLLPTGPGDLTEWDRFNTGVPNWQNATNKNINDTSYVYTPNIGEQDLYTVQAQVYAPVVFGVQVAGFYRQDDATQRYVKNALKTGGTVYRGATKATYQDYTFIDDLFELNPYTGLPFTQAEANGVQIGPYLEA